ncbi:inorganic phosphate transporter [Brevibacterium linens]|uniref:Phosphate transporter n=1 Tax=Brevibacterium linens TaxID=1703 RepID=A0A2H1JVU8_BRELN|nr:inorganic phosphate transporter [Brevibacterium linens]SMX91172.1 inorganic phosphate transporter, PiT family [Brevibacterium linens]
MTQVLAPERHTPPPAVGRSNDRLWHLAFGGLLAITLIAFTLWSFDFVGRDAPRMVLVTTVIFGAFMAFNIGGNDVANAFGTSVGAGTLTMKQALLVAAIFEVSGALLAGGNVTDTVKSGIVDLSGVAINPMDFAFIMMAALLGAAVWLLVATRMGWPVSTTHSIIGGIIGASLTIGFVTGTGGLAMVQWSEVGQIAISWVLSPALGGLAAFVIYGLIKKYVLGTTLSHTLKPHMLAPVSAAEGSVDAQIDAATEDAPTDGGSIGTHSALQRWVPVIAAVGAVIITAMLLFKGLKNLDMSVTTVGGLLIMAMIGATVWLAVFVFAKTLRKQTVPRATYILFSWMQVFTASAFAFSHGSNDIANAVGPFAAVLDVLRTDSISGETTVPFAAMLTCGIALIVGLWFIGRKVIATVGTKLTEIHPASGFAAELAAAGIVMAASVSGLPVSSTHILIGAIIGVGLVNRSANWKLMKPIALAWIITLPAAAAIGSIGVITLRTMMG